MNEKRTHIKKLLSYYKIFLIPFKKKLESEKKTNSPTTQSTKNPIHSTKTFFTNQQEKNLPLLKETNTENLTKKTTGKKNRDCISSNH